MTAVRTIRSDCTVPVFLFYFFFLKASFYHSIGSADDFKSFYTSQIHFLWQTASPMQASRTVLDGGSDRVSPFLFMPFPFSRRIYFVSVRRMRRRLRCIPRHPFNHPFSRMAVNHRTAFPEQRSIHPRTAAQAHIVPFRFSFHRQCHVMTEGGVQYLAYELIRNCFNVQPSGTVWCRQVATTVLRRVIHNYFS